MLTSEMSGQKGVAEKVRPYSMQREKSEANSRSTLQDQHTALGGTAGARLQGAIIRDTSWKSQQRGRDRRSDRWGGMGTLADKAELLMIEVCVSDVSAGVCKFYHKCGI
ncbi:hypothetical protein GOODEAATRI_009312 [Goodea atripinnis]|uniref:Uncharacterized protein n=1 Tax=Goodea atripinnis TaxID=208336 RepID=A0ABV0MZX1_9TELE